MYSYFISLSTVYQSKSLSVNYVYHGQDTPVDSLFKYSNRKIPFRVIYTFCIYLSVCLVISRFRPGSNLQPNYPIIEGPLSKDVPTLFQRF